MSDALTEADRWLRYAQDDLAAAETLLSEKEHTPRHPCWLAQQAAEKALKAALVLAGVNFPKRHDLDALRNLLPEDWAVKRTHPDLAELTEWAVEARYPGDWPDATESDAQNAVGQARALCESVAEDIDRRRP